MDYKNILAALRCITRPYGDLSSRDAEIVKSAMTAIAEQQKEIVELREKLSEREKHGRWMSGNVYPKILCREYTCSVCGRRLFVENKRSLSEYPHCHCGAKMDEEVPHE